MIAGVINHDPLGLGHVLHQVAARTINPFVVCPNWVFHHIEHVLLAQSI